jgi:hypothetical protein
MGTVGESVESLLEDVQRNIDLADVYAHYVFQLANAREISNLINHYTLLLHFHKPIEGLEDPSDSATRLKDSSSCAIPTGKSPPKPQAIPPAHHLAVSRKLLVRLGYLTLDYPGGK